MEAEAKAGFLRTLFEGAGTGLYLVWLLLYAALVQGLLEDFSGGTALLLLVILTTVQIMASLLYQGGVRRRLSWVWMVSTGLQTVYLVYLWITVATGFGQGLFCLYTIAVNALLFIPAGWFARQKDVF
ncbi:hypothetical protein ACKQTC_03945 [Peptococcus simiae]|uniref:Uncharacterized protein n=1 Tax=Peptococcus simiae TaxID=1643805 RepID=A0ABW9GY30_9FIRM